MKRYVLLIVALMAILALIAACAPKPTPSPAAPAPTSAPAPTPVLTVDPDRLVWVWTWSAKFDKFPWNPVNPLALTSYGVKEGPEAPNPECPYAIYQGVERYSVMHETCRVGKAVRIRFSEVMSQFMTKRDEYTENP